MSIFRARVSMVNSAVREFKSCWDENDSARPIFEQIASMIPRSHAYSMPYLMASAEAEEGSHARITNNQTLDYGETSYSFFCDAIDSLDNGKIDVRIGRINVRGDVPSKEQLSLMWRLMYAGCVARGELTARQE